MAKRKAAIDNRMRRRRGEMTRDGRTEAHGILDDPALFSIRVEPGQDRPAAVIGERDDDL